MTESVAIDNIKNYKQIFDNFEDRGIQISIDDFGTGYSNIGYLKKMSVNEIKIDRIFIRDIQPDIYQYNLIKSVVNFAKENNFLVCVEGVENTDELKVIESLNIDIYQGYLFDKPCTAEEILNKYVDSTRQEFEERTEFIDYLKYKKETTSLITFNPKELLEEINIGLWIL
jgi:EAL domain-containing protein (putative c-di-GMP-specific phosphodiesterase class I)